MTTIPELENQIAELQKQLEELKANEWPKEGCAYIYLDGLGISGSCWEGDIVDATRKKRGNVYRTKEEAEWYDKRRIVEARCREIAGGYRFVEGADNYYIQNGGRFWGAFNCRYANLYPRSGYFPTAELAEKALKEIGDDFKYLEEYVG